VSQKIDPKHAEKPRKAGHFAARRLHNLQDS